MNRKPMPYETPDPSGRCWFSELPEEVLHDIFLRLDLGDLTRTFRLCTRLHTFLTESAAVNLRHTLLANSLHRNPYSMMANPKMPRQMPLTSAKVLAHLRETLTRFRNVVPKSTSTVRFREPSGSLYEYLEGVLMRTARMPDMPGGGKSKTLHVYDLRRIDEWEDADDVASDDDDEVLETTSDSPMESDFKSEHTFPFAIREIATDPTQDLLIVVSLTPFHEPGQTHPEYTMEFHMLSLSTFGPHPKAEKEIIEFPARLRLAGISLDFQICDDALYVLSKGAGMFGTPESPQDVLYGWEWTTGRLHVGLEAPPHASFESFVLLTPSSFCITTAVARLRDSDRAPDELTVAAVRQLYWTHHLYLYAFPPLADHSPTGRWTAHHALTIDMPPIKNNLMNGVVPMHTCIRTDPPPRTFNSPYPLHAPPPYLPDPESGVAIITFNEQNMFMHRHPDLPNAPMFTLIVPKTTLAQYLPEPTSPLLRHTFSRPIPVIPFSRLAPNCRFLGPDRVPTPWVCYVYQNRYVAPYARVVGHMPMDEDDDDDEDDSEREIVELSLQVFDFDPRRVRKEKLGRARRLPPGMEALDSRLEGDVDGIELVLEPTRIPPVPCLTDEEIVTGQNMPYIVVERETDSLNPLMDGQRILVLKKSHHRGVTHGAGDAAGAGAGADADANADANANPGAGAGDDDDSDGDSDDDSDDDDTDDDDADMIQILEF